jgi:uncharacterized protein (TIGR03067 family)
MRFRLRLLAVAAVGLVAGSGPVREEPRLVSGIPVGINWKVLYFRIDGKIRKTKAERVTFGRPPGTLRFSWSGQGDSVEFYRIDPGTNLPHFDINSGRRKHLGIYELTGNRLAISFAAPGKPRPKDFTYRRGDGRFVLLLWRE